MKLVFRTSCALLFILLFSCGCEPPGPPAPLSDGNNGADAPACLYYAPAKIDVLPLTEFAPARVEGEARINAYVSLLDSFGSQMKAPGKFRFELYQHVERSTEPKGARVKLWRDIDLTQPGENNKNWRDFIRAWRDFIRAYQFDLGFEPSGATRYILEVTCLTPNGRRLRAEVPLTRPK